jgi:hypothetical protein
VSLPVPPQALQRSVDRVKPAQERTDSIKKSNRSFFIVEAPLWIRPNNNLSFLCGKEKDGRSIQTYASCFRDL